MTEGTSRVQLDEGDVVVKTGGFMRELRGCAQWLVQISKLLKYSEERLMKANMMGHEAVRHFGSVLDDAVPPPKGDWGWPMRHCHDLAAISVRMFAQLYLRGDEGAEAFVRRAMSLVRLYMEEAVRRMLLFTTEAKMRLGGIVTTQ